MSGVNVVGVVGAGQMGGGIAEVCARAGVSVRLFDVDDDVVSRGLARINQSLGRAERGGRVTVAERAEALGRITSTTDLDALADAALVVEAVVEDEESSWRCSAVWTPSSSIRTRSWPATLRPSRS